MKFVGLKTVAMAAEGRFSSIVINEKDRSKEHTRVSTDTGLERPETENTDENVKARILEEEHILARANKTDRELREKEEMQLTRLVHLLKEIEVQVNASQDGIFQSLSDHRASMQMYIQKAIKYVYQERATNDTFIMVKLLINTYDHVRLTLGTVEIGVKQLMGKLAEIMCVPLVDYVKDLRYEMTAGTYHSILAIMEEISGAMRLQRLELEDARMKVIEAEKRSGGVLKLSMLKGTEIRMGNLEEASDFRVETRKPSIQPNVTWKEEHILARANKASREIREKEEMQLTRLVHLLQQIEVQLNASQDGILQSLSDHRASTHIYVQKAVKCVSSTHQERKTNDTLTMLKLVINTYDHVRLTLGAVEIGVKELMGKLAEKMCVPLADYAKDVRCEMTAGTYHSILAIMEEISGAMRLQRLELEDARMKVIEAETRRGRVLKFSMLKGTEKRMGKLEEASDLRVGTKKPSVQPNLTEKSMKYLEVEEDQANDEKIQWDSPRKRSKLQTPDNPFGPNRLLGIGTGDKNLKTTIIQAMKLSPICCEPPPPNLKTTIIQDMKRSPISRRSPSPNFKTSIIQAMKRSPISYKSPPPRRWEAKRNLQSPSLLSPQPLGSSTSVATPPQQLP